VSFTVEWGKDESRPDGHGLAVVSTVTELDSVLDAIEGRCAETGQLFVVHVYAMDDADGLPGGVQIGVGHSQRSFAYWLGDEGGSAFEPDLPSGPADLRFDYGGQPIFPTPEELRLRPAVARQIARDYVQSRLRPGWIGWQRQDGADAVRQ
jgi:hypothetical protein